MPLSSVKLCRFSSIGDFPEREPGIGVSLYAHSMAYEVTYSNVDQ